MRRWVFASAFVMLLVDAAGMGTGQAAGLPIASKSLAVFRSCVLSANTAASTSAADSYVDQNAASTNNGSAMLLDSQSGPNQNRRVYIRFDLTRCSPVIPSTATVKLATLRLFTTAVPAACRTEDIFASTSAWTEAAITWNNQPFGTTINSPSNATRTDAITIGAAPCTNTTVNAYVNGWTVTSNVQSWVAGSATNNGWMIRDDAEGSSPARNARFTSKNVGSNPQAPQLIVSTRHEQRAFPRRGLGETARFQGEKGGATAAPADRQPRLRAGGLDLRPGVVRRASTAAARRHDRLRDGPGREHAADVPLRGSRHREAGTELPHRPDRRVPRPPGRRGRGVDRHPPDRGGDGGGAGS